MARTKDEIRDHLIDLGPGFLCEPDELADAMLLAFAAVWEDVEASTEKLHDRTFVCEADGAWLDRHGAERGLLRFDGEPDEDYAARIKDIEDKVTLPAIQAALDDILVVGTATIHEHTKDGLWMIRSGSSDPRAFLGQRLYRSGQSLCIFISEQTISKSDTSFLIRSGAAGTRSFMTRTGAIKDRSMFLDGVELAPSDIYTRIIDTLERLRAGGISYVVEVG